MLTILDSKQFRASHDLLGGIRSKVFIFDRTRPVRANGRVIGYYMKGNRSYHAPIEMICEALENGFSTKGLTTLELIN